MLLFTPIPVDLFKAVLETTDLQWLSQFLIQEEEVTLARFMFDLPNKIRWETLRHIGEIDRNKRMLIGILMDMLRYMFDDYPTCVQRVITDKQGRRRLNYYAVLGAPLDATQEELRKRIKVIGRALQRQYRMHTTSELAAQLQRDFSEAVHILRHSKRRAEYDTQLNLRIPAEYPRRNDRKYEIVLEEVEEYRLSADRICSSSTFMPRSF